MCAEPDSKAQVQAIPEARVVCVAVAVPAQVAYGFARRMDALPLWASGLATGVAQVRGEWLCESPMGTVRVVMAPENTAGVLDHDVTLPDGVTVHNAFRVSPLADHACIFSFVVVRQAGTSDAAFAADVAHVERDLKTLKDLLEQSGGVGRSLHQ